MQLQPNTLLQGGKYRIEKVLGQGGFGITYLATQDLLDRKVCIKEFFYKEYCERDEATSHVSLGTQSNHEIVERFLNKFLKEARTISQLEHPNIIKIHDIFKENNTAYYVMEYIEGESLSDKVNHYGALSETEAVGYIRQVASALDFIHQRSINHLDVKPANIMVRRADNKAILIDFGLSKQYDAQGGQTSTTPVGVSHGYAPMEQYNVDGVNTFSPQADIYSLGATLYKLVTGNTPPSAMEVLNEGLPTLPTHISDEVKNAISLSMQAKKSDRPANIEQIIIVLPLKGTNTQHENHLSLNSGNENEETEIILNKAKTSPIVVNDFTEKKTNDKRDKVLKIALITIGVLSPFLGIIFLSVYCIRRYISGKNSKRIQNLYLEAQQFELTKDYKRAIDSYKCALDIDCMCSESDSIFKSLGNCCRLIYDKEYEKVRNKADNLWKLGTNYKYGTNGFVKDKSNAKRFLKEAINMCYNIIPKVDNL